MKAYTNLSSASYLMLFVQSYVDRRVELQDVNGRINPVIVHPRAQLHFGLALSDNSSLVLVGRVLGTNDTVFLNQFPKVRIQPENDIYKQAHIVLAANNSKQTGKTTLYNTEQGGDSRLNMSSEIQKSMENSGKQVSQIKEVPLTMTFRNTLGVVVEVTEITGAVEPTVLLPFEVKTLRLLVKKTWPLIFHANSGNQMEEILVNGQRQLRVYLPLDMNGLNEITVTSRNTGLQHKEDKLNAVMLSINNTLEKPVVLFDISNLMKPLVVPEHRICQVGFFVKTTGFVMLAGITLGGKTEGVTLNGETQILVSSSQNPSQDTLITISELTNATLSGPANNSSDKGNETTNDSQGNEDHSKQSQDNSKFVMLSIKNTLDFAVKFIELTGARKPFIVPPKSDTQLGFDVVRNGPIVLRAISTDSNESLLLNEQNSLKIDPAKELEKVTNILVAKKGHQKKLQKRLLTSLPSLILMHR